MNSLLNCRSRPRSALYACHDLPYIDVNNADRRRHRAAVRAHCCGADKAKPCVTCADDCNRHNDQEADRLLHLACLPPRGV